MAKFQEFKFVGDPEIQQVAQPQGTELCFASIVSAMTGSSVAEAHEVLVANDLSQTDGSTGPMGETRLEVAGSVLDIKPVIDPFSGIDKSETVIERIDEKLLAARAVALLYKKTDNSEDDRHHWALLTGYLQQDGQKGAMRVMDPLRPRIGYLRRRQLEDIIKRSMDFMGVYAYALSASRED